jgi:23S rRNA pseudouridine1911/1915/1917 synthase
LDHETITFSTGAEDAKDRLDRVLARAAPAFSRSRLKALIEEGCVTLAGQVVTDANHKVNPDMEVVLNVPPPEDPEPLGEPIPLDVIHEDDQLIVINKQAGLVVHPAAGHWTGTLVNALVAHCGDTLSGIGGVRRPGIVHRLDKDTTGLMVVAKTDAAHKALSEQFADHGRTGPLKRAYLAFVWGRPARERLTIDKPLDRDTKNREKQAVRPSGRQAITHVSVLESFPSRDNPIVSLLRCELETGRTHQIRVHLASEGYPLLGDELYGTGFKTKGARLPPKAHAAWEALGRQALHAFVLGFAHPVNDEEVYYEAPMPEDLQRLKDALAAWA